MTTNLPAKKTPVERLKETMAMPSVREQFENALADNSPLFVASLIDLFGGDKYLQECQPGAVIMEALKAATLKLPINKSLGFAYVIAYKGKPGFQIGYKGLLQLAMRTGQYRFINADVVYEGELLGVNKLTGEIALDGQRASDKIVGYFSYMETLNGFQKALYWTKEQVTTHAKRFSQSFNSANSSPWKTDFDAMAVKTVLKALLSKYGVMSVEMVRAWDADRDDDPEAAVNREIAGAANQDYIDMEPTKPLIDDPGMTPEEIAEIQAREMAEASAQGGKTSTAKPGF